MIARYIRRTVRRDGEVVLTLSCGHQVFMSAQDYWEQTRAPKWINLKTGEEGPMQTWTPTCYRCPECKTAGGK